jgi:signal transduction histidine kinase
LEQRVQLRKKYIANIPRWRYPIIGYIVTVPLIVLVAFSDWYLTQVLGKLIFPSTVFILAILFVASLWGVGPSLFAILLSAVAFDYLYITPFALLNFEHWKQVAQLGPFVVSGMIIALITAQRERAHLQALATEQELQSYAEELEDANCQLQDANQMKDRFLSIATHELKTPVTTIRGQAQLMLRRISKQKNLSTDIESIEAGLERINDQTGRLTVLIDELLDVSSMRTGKVALKKRLYDLGALCREVADDQSLLTGRHITVELPQEPIKMQIDGDRMSQVLTNLISNAAKYSPDKQPIEVKYEAQGDDVLLTVTDHGKGIAKDQLEHIFETFYRTPDAQSSSKRGLGLGLAISKDIVERHGGRIWCESVAGQGSTFFVELPIESELK